MNCIAVIAPKKKTVGTAKACTANQRTVKMGYVIEFFVVIFVWQKVKNNTEYETLKKVFFCGIKKIPNFIKTTFLLLQPYNRQKMEYILKVRESFHKKRCFKKQFACI